MVHKHLLGIATTAIAVLLLGALPAKASFYYFSFTALIPPDPTGTVASGSGVFAITPSGSNYLITNIYDGIYNGDAITGLLPVDSYPPDPTNDNILLSLTTPPKAIA
jgi:hypothetical protein